MVQFVNVRELKNHVSAVMRRARRGDVVVTSRGKPAAVLHAVTEGDLEDYLLAHSPKLQELIEMSSRERRAWVHKASSFKDAERFDTRFWRRAGAAARFEAAWAMVSEFLKMRGKSGAQLRLRRSIQRIERP